MQHGFTGKDKWASIILVGTKADRATKEEMDSFTSQALDEDGNHVGVAARFFSDIGGSGGSSVVRSLQLSLDSDPWCSVGQAACTARLHRQGQVGQRHPGRHEGRQGHEGRDGLLHFNSGS